MITALTALLVLISLGLVVTVPVALATPGEWESSKGNFKVSKLVALILIIAASDGIAASFNNLEIIVKTIISKLF
jgi:photosystem II core protein PsbZ